MSTMRQMPVLTPLGEHAWIVRWGRDASPAWNAAAHALHGRLRLRPFPGMIETVPSYAALTVFFDPARCSPEAAEAAIRQAIDEYGNEGFEIKASLVEIPVRYGGEDGPDLEFVAERNGLAAEEVVRLHSGADYTVAMIGFTPGFPYMFGLPESLATPRKDVPRTIVPAGSVGIAGAQTGIYPFDSPGGWQIIGRTDIRLFDHAREPLCVLRPGDRVRFVPIGGMRP